jgi:hypothetical protein
MSTSASTRQPGEGAQPGQDFQPWTLWGLIAKHKVGTLILVGLIALAVIPFVLVAVGSKAGAVTDATTCTGWGSADQTRQTAYAELYLREHGPIPRWGGSPADVINAINSGCDQAYGDDVADTATIVQAINGTF